LILALAVAAPQGSDAHAFFAALEESGALATSDVSVYIAQDATRPLDAAPSGVSVQTAEPGSSIFQLWGLAIRATKARNVALLDARCPIERGWLAAMRASLETNPVAVFGPVRCGWAVSSPHVVGYLVEYAQFQPPLGPSVQEVPGLNLVAARHAVVDAAVLKDDGFVKTRLMARLAALGTTPLPIEDAVVTYRKQFTFTGYCAHRFHHGRSYGAARDFASPWPWLRAVVVTPGLPLLRALRIHRAARQRQQLRAAFWRWIHRIIVAETAWSIGELFGYLAGAGPSRCYLR
jgi:hypothetical protein